MSVMGMEASCEEEKHSLPGHGLYIVQLIIDLVPSLYGR